MDPAAAAAAASSSSYGEQRPSPRRELQGPRPSPLKVSKDSHKIAKKPPLFPHPYLPPPQHQQQHHHQQPLLQIQNQIQNQHHRSPVIIYAVSPKVIHTTPSDFMSLVQRLTGNSLDTSSSSSSAAAAAAAAAPSTTAAAAAAAEAATTLLLSPAAAAAASPRPQHHRQQQLLFQQQQELQVDEGGVDVVELLTGRAGAGAGAWAGGTISSFFPGILSPGPASLPPISPSLFLASPSLGFDPSVLGYLGDLSPVLSGMVLASPGNSHLLSTPTIPSPGAFWDLLNHFPDLS